MIVDSAIDYGYADAAAIEALAPGHIRANGGDRAYGGGGDEAVRGDVLNARVGGEGGEGGGRDAGGEAVDEAEFADGALGGEVDATEGEGPGGPGGAGAGGGSVFELDDDVDGFAGVEVGEVGSEFPGLGEKGGDGGGEEEAGGQDSFDSRGESSSPDFSRRSGKRPRFVA